MDDQPRPDFFRRALRRRWLIVLISLLLGLAAVPAYMATATTEYRATSVVFLEPLVGNPYAPTTPTGRQEQLAALTTEAGLLLTDSVAQSASLAADDVGIDLGSRVQERTVTSVPSNSQVVNVSFAAPTPETAQFGAQALATAYLDYRQARAQEVGDAQLARLDQELASLSALVESTSSDLDAARAQDNANEAEVLRLEEQLRIYANQFGQLRIERVNVESASTTPGEIVTPAQLPRQPEGLSSTLVAIALVGALLGCGVVAAIVLEHLDSRIRTADELERLGITPAFGPAPMWRPHLHGTPATDAYRLALGSSPAGVHALLGSSAAVPVEVAAGLARTLTDAGRSVLIVFASPVPMPGPRSNGLSDLLERDASSPRVEVYQFESGVSALLPGSKPESLLRLIHRPAFGAVVEAAASRHDVVLLVGETAQSASGAVITNACRRVLLLARTGRTRHDELAGAARMVEDGETHLDGVMLVNGTARWRRRQLGGSTHDALVALLGPSSTEPWPGPALDENDATTSRQSMATPSLGSGS